VAAIGNYSFYFAEPLWLIATVLLIPVAILGWRRMASLGPVRRSLAIALRCLLMLVLILLLARFNRAMRNDEVTVILVLDRSQSVPEGLQQAAIDYLEKALKKKVAKDQLAVIDIAEFASISKLSSGDTEIRRRNVSLKGLQSKLAEGVQMAMAIAPPGSAVRILLCSDGNQTAGDLKEAARIAAINGIPIDVLPLRYTSSREVVFKNLVAPPRARANQTIALRFILSSTAQCSGKLLLSLNGKPVDLVPDSPEMASPIELKPGTNVKTVSVPVGSRGMHEFEATFMPDDPADDRISQNNRATAMTFVAGPGSVLVVDADGKTGQPLADVLKQSNIEAVYTPVSELPANMTRLMDTDAVILVNTSCSAVTYEQQEMLVRYVNDTGGGLVMIGGAESFGAGGWIGSPVAKILPVDCDPPQKKQMPKGALVLIMHSCEMPQGNLWGERVAIAAVSALSKQDLAGILTYQWQGSGSWAWPLAEVGDKTQIIAAIKQMEVGDMPDLGGHLQAAYYALKTCDAAQKHIIVISDGDPQPPTSTLLGAMKADGITCTGVAVFPHSPGDSQSLQRIAQLTGGRFYDVRDPQKLPQIFIKEAQTVRRALIVEETFTPNLTWSLSEVVKGLPAMPSLDGYVLTGPKEGLSQVVLSSRQNDPILATCQSGLGRCLAFTSSVDSRWASQWLAWPANQRFWEQAVRWAGKPTQANDCEVMVDVQGRQVDMTVDAVDEKGAFQQFASIDAQLIAPDMSLTSLPLAQTGPGEYRARFEAPDSGSYIVNLRYRKPGADAKTLIAQTPVTVPFSPEFRDLSDNAGLLVEVSTVSGGRVLPPDPNSADLYTRAGLKLPQTQLPTSKPLMVTWLVLLLLDVAVRRVAVDWRAIGRRFRDVFRSRSARKSDATIDRLKVTRTRTHERLTSRQAEAAGRHYEAAAGSSVSMPMADISKPPQVAEPAKPKSVEPLPQDKSHIQQLLKAKRKALEDRKDNENKQDQ
jgi:uncharacterized membrane protein